ncbi:hypothetical protein Syun_004505 [Stephania yunnanensis]|uniref:EF-hand domain-containing protein n=1 Tax=Stephania yunnanensis TaxID=152371 RepID=A0AAP0L379_9MAGN
MAGIVASPNPTPFGSLFPGSNGNPFASLLPSSFPPGTPQHIVDAFRYSDKDGNGFIDDQELKAVLSTCNHGFSLRTIHLLMYSFTATNTRLMGPKEFTQMFTSLQQWRDVFEKNDRDRNGKIEFHELQQTFQTLGFNVPKAVLKLLLLKFDRTGKTPALDYDKFIECCISVKGLANKFKENESAATGQATFSYESFLFSVMPFVLA